MLLVDRALASNSEGSEFAKGEINARCNFQICVKFCYVGSRVTPILCIDEHFAQCSAPAAWLWGDVISKVVLDLMNVKAWV